MLEMFLSESERVQIRQIIIEKAPFVVVHITYNSFYTIRPITKQEYNFLYSELKRLEDIKILINWVKYKQENIYRIIGSYSNNKLIEYKQFGYLFKNDFEPVLFNGNKTYHVLFNGNKTYHIN